MMMSLLVVSLQRLLILLQLWTVILVCSLQTFLFLNLDIAGYPITTEEVKYGLRVSVLVLPADPKLLTDRALEVVGPKGFQMNDIDYIKPIPLL